MRYADQIVMYLDGAEVEIASFSATPTFDKREAVPTMNSTGRPLGHRKSVGACDISVKVPHRAGLPYWAGIESSTALFRQQAPGTPSYRAFGVFYKSHSPSTDTEGEQMIDLELGCLDFTEGVEPG